MGTHVDIIFATSWCPMIIQGGILGYTITRNYGNKEKSNLW